jgi:hypothetical protein
VASFSLAEARRRELPPAVPQRVRVLLILFSWFLASGSQWEVVQVFGWARMVVRYADSMSVVQAIERTFGGEMCGVCQTVNAARDPSETPGLPPDGAQTKPLLICFAPPEVILGAPASGRLPPSDWRLAGCDRASPPTPPPRAA